MAIKQARILTRRCISNRKHPLTALSEAGNLEYLAALDRQMIILGISLKVNSRSNLAIVTVV